MNIQVSNAITRLRVIATIIIVAYHAACPYGVWDAFIEFWGTKTSKEIINFVFQRLLCNDMLPMFFSLSGMLYFAKKETYKDWLLVFWRKFDRLIVPAALIILFCSWFDIPFVGHAGPEGHLWFIYVLFLYFCWFLTLSRVNIHILMLIAVTGYGVYSFSGRLELSMSSFVLQLLRYQIYFVGGYYMFKYYDLLRKNFIRWLLLLIYLVSLLLDFQTGYYLLFNVVALAFIPQRDIVSRMMRSLNVNSFGIYLIHHILIVASFQLSFVYNSYIDYPLLAIVSMFLVAIIISWTLSEVLHRIKFRYF